MMKISYEEFNNLQEQQKIRDYAQDVYHKLFCLEQLVKRKDKKQVRDMMFCINSIEEEAIRNIKEMIEGVSGYFEVKKEECPLIRGYKRNEHH